MNGLFAREPSSCAGYKSCDTSELGSTIRRCPLLILRPRCWSGQGDLPGHTRLSLYSA